MSFEFPLMQSLLMRLNVDNVPGRARVLPCYEYNPFPKVIHVNLYTTDNNYARSLVKGLMLYLNQPVNISIQHLPKPMSLSQNSAFFYPEIPFYRVIKIDSKDIDTLCNLLGIKYTDIYREFEPRACLPIHSVRP